MKRTTSDMNESIRAAKTDKASGHGRILVVCVCVLIACILLIGVLVAWLISLYRVPHITGDRDLDREIDISVSECYAEYTIPGLVNVRRDQQNIANLCLVESDGGLHLGYLMLDLFEGEHTVRYNEFLKDIKTGEIYNIQDGTSAYTITFCIYDRKENIPSGALQTETVKTSNGEIYFCVTEIADITQK